MNKSIKTVPLQYTYQNGDVATLNIDSSIATLIEEIWKANIDTIQQCLEDPTDSDPHNNNNIKKDPNYVFLQFASSIDYTKFMSIVADFDDPTNDKQLEMYYTILNTNDNFITRFNLHDHNMPVADHPEDFVVDIKNCKYKHPIPKIDINCCLYFKKELIDSVTERLVSYNKINKNKPYTEDLLCKSGDPYKYAHLWKEYDILIAPPLCGNSTCDQYTTINYNDYKDDISKGISRSKYLHMPCVHLREAVN